MEYRVEECFDMADSLKMLKKKKEEIEGIRWKCRMVGFIEFMT